ncbi:hypothetical protein U1Q18_031036 [Sarracenia purpurea var. burkii]
MVCSLGNGRMAAMARLLAAGSFSQTIAEEIGNQKLAALYIQRELREADEANLLDEDDMHVFGLKPMTDPLHLVCCNACKKPIKVTQYAAHAVLCKTLSSTEEFASEIDGVTGHHKPPRKERKKLPSGHASTTGGEKERFQSAEAHDVATSQFHLDDQAQLNSSFFMEAKRYGRNVSLLKRILFNSLCESGHEDGDRGGDGAISRSNGGSSKPDVDAAFYILVLDVEAEWKEVVVDRSDGKNIVKGSFSDSSEPGWEFTEHLKRKMLIVFME